jgi:hypothetical protein
MQPRFIRIRRRTRSVPNPYYYKNSREAEYIDETETIVEKYIFSEKELLSDVKLDVKRLGEVEYYKVSRIHPTIEVTVNLNEQF